ncbi:MAG: sigma-70 family RNA polymerase sigma factor [Verrucomicrobia bacterium]|nr:sigma-70 family RNA polymerase sigma factor [Verrucomicrobiota bacterium]
MHEKDATFRGSAFAGASADGRRTDDGEQIPDAELLRRYVFGKSEDAFAELVRRHIDLVYSVALRQVGGDMHLAQDVAQVVFTSLARKAEKLAERPVLGGWLYRTTQFAAIDTVRAASRRRARESEATTMHELTTNPGAEVDWEKLRPTLDQVIGELADDDRDAVVLRFFEGKSFADVGARLRLTENAARMRVERALDKLHAALARRGVTSTTAALALALANQAGVAAPTGLAASVTGAALAGAAATGSETGAAAAAGLLHFMGSTKLIITSAAVIAVAAIGVVINQARATRATRAEAVAIGRQQDELQAKLRNVEGNLAVAERRAQAADADVAQLLKAVQDASNAGRLPAGSGPRVAFVVDTSGSMRNPQNGKLWRGVFDTIAETLAARPEVRFVQVLDADGRSMLVGRDGWRPAGAEALREIERVLGSYNGDTDSNPVPGVLRALRGLPAPDDKGAKLEVWVVGDEFVEWQDSILRQLDRLNPADAGGKRRASIGAIQLPTTVRSPGGPMTATGLKFQALMTEVAKQHAGTYKLLSDGALH